MCVLFGTVLHLYFLLFDLLFCLFICIRWANGTHLKFNRQPVLIVWSTYAHFRWTSFIQIVCICMCYFADHIFYTITSSSNRHRFQLHTLSTCKRNICGVFFILMINRPVVTNIYTVGRNPCILLLTIVCCLAVIALAWFGLTWLGF